METTAITADQVINYIEAQLVSAKFAQDNFVKQIASDLRRAETLGWNVHHARIIEQVSGQLLEASSKVEALENLLRGMKG
jgi:hypothetical protein